MGIAGKEVLIIDDDADSRKLLRNVLETAGMSVEEAADVEQGLKSAEARVPHLILCDLRMPGLSGFDFLEKKRWITSLVKTPVLVISAANDRESVYKAMSLGASDYLIKPFTTALLLQKAGKALHDRSSLSVKFAEGEEPVAQATVFAEVIRVNEAGFTLDIPARIAPDTELQIASAVLTELGFDKHPLKTRGVPIPAGAVGRYILELIAPGIKEDTVKRIREIVQAWK